MGSDVASIKRSILKHLEYSMAKDEHSATKRDWYKSVALAVRDRLIERWIQTQQTYYKVDAKRIYYLSMEYLIGRLLGDALINLGIYENTKKALSELGYDLDELRSFEADAGLGNGGLGRLAACFMDSMATLELPAYGYGIRYEYGIFNQKIRNGFQTEAPDSWLRYGNPWEIERPEYIYMVRFYGRVEEVRDEAGSLHIKWVDTQDIVAMAYDTPVSGFENNTVNNLRLWSAKSTRDFDLEKFNEGEYEKAVADKIDSESLSKVLYPRDDLQVGRELRLRQEYFLVSATLQDIMRRYKKVHDDGFSSFPDKVVLQLNDTHPALAIPELMRILLDEEHLPWQRAWEITTKVFAYTNHTVLPEALEKWPVSLLQKILPRHLKIIYEINRRFLDLVEQLFPGDEQVKRRVSLIEERQEKLIRMAHLAIVGSFSVNGVAELHSEILKNNLFADFFKIWPGKFNNKTNGITQRRWLSLCNPGLAGLISDAIGDGWIKDLSKLKDLTAHIGDGAFIEKWQQVKRDNKVRLASYIYKKCGIRPDPDSLFDVQVKRIHEYKRQLLNLLHVITLYNWLRHNPGAEAVPRTVIFSGKAAPSYFRAKQIIKLINSVADVVNNDPQIHGRLKVVFMENYSVSLAQEIIPAADLSEQISTAGMEASGTGNMKLALNGALTIGTLDGANIEIREEVGADNIFIFGLQARQVLELRQNGYFPRNYYRSNPELKECLDMISSGAFLPENPDLFSTFVDSLLDYGDYFLVMADYADYVECQGKVDQTFTQKEQWAVKSILNVAHMGKFSSDRTIREYSTDIWKASPVSITL